MPMRGSTESTIHQNKLKETIYGIGKYSYLFTRGLLSTIRVVNRELNRNNKHDSAICETDHWPDTIISPCSIGMLYETGGFHVVYLRNLCMIFLRIIGRAECDHLTYGSVDKLALY